eukprot:115738-Amphidinium_carterae.1
MHTCLVCILLHTSSIAGFLAYNYRLPCTIDENTCVPNKHAIEVDQSVVEDHSPVILAVLPSAATDRVPDYPIQQASKARFFFFSGAGSPGWPLSAVAAAELGRSF